MVEVGNSQLVLMHRCPGNGAAEPVLLACGHLDPMGWRGGCLAAGLVLDALHHYCLGGCSAPLVCARRSWQIRKSGAIASCCFCPPPPSCVCPRFRPCGAFSGTPLPGVPCHCLLVRHSRWAARSAIMVKLPLWCLLSFLCVVVRCLHFHGPRVRPLLLPSSSPTLRGALAGSW